MPRRRRFRMNYPLLAAIAVFVLVVVTYIGWGVLSAWLTPQRSGLPNTFLAFVAKCLDATLAIWFFAVGASIGSFLNVVAYRLPLGKTLGGHSACPFCTTAIKTSDNIPVIAWLRLRGRCRACRLPISIQYPLVELAVGLVFLSIYFTEFGLAGSNLPGSRERPQGLGLIWMSVTPVLAWRTVLYVYVLSGFIAAALMIVRHSRPPMTLFAWLSLPLILAPAIDPAIEVEIWSGHSSRMVTHIDALLTLACSLASGLLVSALTLPLTLGVSNNQSDREVPERSEHAIVWIGTVICLALLMGWQAVPGVVSLILLLTLIGPVLVSRFMPSRTSPAALFEPVTWAWLGLLIYRANWKTIDSLLGLPPIPARWGGPAICLVLSLGLAWCVGRLRPLKPLEDREPGHDLPVLDQSRATEPS